MSHNDTASHRRHISSFDCKYEGDRVHLHLEAVQRVFRLLDYTGKRLIFDASLLGEKKRTGNFTFPLEKATFLIERESHPDLFLELSLPAEPRLGPKSRSFLGLKPSMWFAALFCHALLVFAFLFWQGRSTQGAWGQVPKGDPGAVSQENSAEAPGPNAASAPAHSVSAAQRVSFTGQSIWYHKRRANSSRNRERLAALIESSADALAAPVAHGIAKGAGQGDEILDSSIQAFRIGKREKKRIRMAEEAAAPSKKEPVKTLSRSDLMNAQAELKRAFDQIHPRFRKIYDELLLKDPQFKVHMVLTGRVDESGRIQELQSSSSGAQEEQSALVQELFSRLKAEVKKIKITPRVGSFKLRRELVFWR